MTTPDGFSPVFIVGVPRSGTTLLRMLLNAHSNISLSPETHFFKQICDKSDVYNSEVNSDSVIKIWDEYVETKHGQDLGFDASDVSYVRGNSPSYKLLLKNILERFSVKNNKIICGEKTPGHLFFVPEILHWFPDAKVVHIVRDPRSVCLSLKKVGWGSKDVVSNARVWNRYINLGNDLMFKYPSSILEIRYEDLINNTSVTLNLVCDFLGVKNESKMLEFYKNSSKFIEKNEPWKDEVKSPLNQSNLKKWGSELTPVEIHEITIKSKKLMINKSYIPDDLNGFIKKLSFLISMCVVSFKWYVRRTFRYITNTSN